MGRVLSHTVAFSCSTIGWATDLCNWRSSSAKTDVEELDGLPEAGPATAEAIVEYRRANGLFRSVSELEEVPGIGPATLEKIKPFATV